MKAKIYSSLFVSVLMVAGLLLPKAEVMAQVQNNYIVVSGQIINSQDGTPVKNHSVFFLKDSTVTIDSGPLLTEVVTDDDGFYYDTILTRTSKGSLLVYTYDYFDIKFDTLKHYRFVSYANSNIIVTNFHIFMPVEEEPLQSRFSYHQKVTGDPYRFRFVDRTENDAISHWEWNFGDGTTSNEQHPDHTFPGPGFYKVRLTVTARVENAEKTSTMVHIIYLAERSFYHLGGHAYAGYFPANNCLAYLYYLDEYHNTIPVDTVSVDTLGFYTFLEVPTGRYYVKVQPKKTSELYGTMLPTYYGNVVFWQDAKVIEHNQTFWGYHVWFVEAKGMESGDGTISGNVKYIGINGGPDFDLPAQGIDIFVMDAEGNSLVSHYSGIDGSFEFPDVAMGTYWLYPEVAGLNQKKIRVEVTPEDPEVSDIEIVLTPGDIDGFEDLTEDGKYNTLGTPYPNPAVSQVKVNIETRSNQTALVELYDLQGRRLVSRQVGLQAGSNVLSLQTSDLQRGVYIIRTLICETVSQQRFIVSR